MGARQKGFTIVELLIVIIVIAILAAITIVAYNGIQNRSKTSSLQADLSNARKKLLLYQVDYSDFPASAAVLATVGIKATKVAYDTTGNNFYYCYNRVTKEFAMGARTTSITPGYIISSSNGTIQTVGSGVGGDNTCQAIGLTGYADPNAYISNGYGNGVGWSSWVGS